MADNKNTYIKPKINNKIRKCRIDATVLGLLEKQVKHEADNSILYRTLQQLSYVNGYEGAGDMFGEQAKEEMKHMKKICDYIVDRGGEAPIVGGCTIDVKFTSLCDLLKLAFSREIETTELLVSISQTATLKRDFVTANFMNWFLNEQIEEEAKYDKLLEEIGNIEDGNDAIVWFSDSLKWRFDIGNTKG